MNYSVKTFGCKVNTYDSALIQKHFNQEGWNEKSVQNFNTSLYATNTKNNNFIHIVNTCAVTNEAVREAARWIRQYRKKNPNTHIVVTGCAAQVETEFFSTLKEVDLIVANSHKSELTQIIQQFLPPSNSYKNKTNVVMSSMSSHPSYLPPKANNSENKPIVFKSSIFKKTNLEIGGGVESHHSRLFLKIQDGCNSFCTFCVIPFARGKSRSIPPETLIRSIQNHYECGVREVVLTGVHIGDYHSLNSNQSINLASLLKILLKRTKMPRFRLSSLEPIELTDELLDLYTDDRVCPHFHLSIQSFNSNILEKMKRKYTASEVKKCLWKINKKLPTAFIGMDIIAGFPEETVEQFNDTYSRLKDTPWTALHVFPYSTRRYTYAARMYTAWPRSIAMKRAALLRHMGEDRLHTKQQQQIGTIQAVLPLKKQKNNNHSMGISRHYWTVEYPQLTNNKNEILLSIRAINKKSKRLIGNVVGYRKI